LIVAVDINEAHLTVAALGVTHTVNAKTHNLADLLRLPVLVLEFALLPMSPLISDEAVSGRDCG
jgi:hypothetical protein